MYGKLDGGELIKAPQILKIDGWSHYNPSEEQYRSQGYLPVIETPYPNAGIFDSETPVEIKHYIPEWREENGAIVRVWRELDGSDGIEQEKTPEPMTLEERLCQAESELAREKERTERLCADLVYLCMMNDIEPVSEVSE